jgi:drug/metabolite transporter (DMT)-like permease
MYANMAIAAGIVVLTSLGQILLKLGAGSRSHLIFNRYVIAGYALFVLVMFLSAVLMRHVDLKYFSVIIGLNYLSGAVAAMIFLRESVNAKKLLGCVLIALGAAIFSI